MVSVKTDDSLWNYARELMLENRRLTARVGFLENEIQRLIPAAYFLRTRDQLHAQIQKYVGLVEACRAYRRAKSKQNSDYVINALRHIEEEVK